MGLAAARQGRLLAVLCLAPAMVVLDSNIVTVALPAMRELFGGADSGVQWVVSAYALAFGGFLLVGGRVADVHGRRRTLVGGLALFSGASAAGGLALSPAMLVVARAVQGIGAALAVPAALSVLTTTFPEGRERNRALGTFGVVISAALVSGVAVGGVVTDLFGWRGALLVTPVFGVAGVIGVRAWVVESERGGERLAGELPRGAAATLGLVAVLVSLTTAAREGWGAWETAVALLLGLACIGFAVVADRRARRPLVSRVLLGRKTLGAGAVGALLTVGTGIGVLVVLSLYLQEVLGYGALGAGLLLTPLGVAGVLAARACPRLANRFGEAAVLAGALVVQAVGVAVMVAIEPGTGVAVVLVGVTIMGVGHFGANVAFTALGTQAIGAADQGVAVAVINAAQQVGGGLGLALLVTIAAARTDAVGAAGGGQTPAAIVAGYQWALGAGAVLSVLGAGLVVAIMRRRA